MPGGTEMRAGGERNEMNNPNEIIDTLGGLDINGENLDDAIADLQKMKERFGGLYSRLEIRLEADGLDDCYAELRGIRPMTPAEIAARDEVISAADRREYERLRAKFEGAKP